jgi:glyoxylate reductase
VCREDWFFSGGGGNEREARAARVDLPRLLAESDFVSLHVPLTAETRHLIGEKELASMKPTAVLVNTARGPVVDEEALVRALKGKKIFAAGLDVFEKEPQLAPGLAELPNVLLAPHAGSATVEARAEMSVLAARNVLAVLEGRPALTPVGI